tara:strand:+ start:739 stop:1662 length:924 start_codon:yes stop_codon:yes gene_type:complete
MSEKKILVLGASGMLGKMVSLHLNSKKFFDVIVTSRSQNKFISENFSGKYLNLDINFNTKNFLNKFFNENSDYKYIVNCIGVIKPKINESDISSIQNTILTNSYFPLDIQEIANQRGIKYIQIGTDCVYSGKDGNYKENSYMDAEDLYGKSKIVGEIPGQNKFLIRSSIIGPEEGTGYSLMNWFLKNKDLKVSGFKNHLWNGVTTLNFSRIVEGIIMNDEIEFKIQHLLPKNNITKANLLEAFKECFKKDIKIDHVDADIVIDRTLDTNNTKVNQDLWTAAGYSTIPTIEENIEELANSEFTKKIMV